MSNIETDDSFISENSISNDINDNSLINEFTASNQINDNIAINDGLSKGDKSQLSESKSIYVSTNGSDDSGDGSEKSPYQSIKHAVSKADDDSIIYLSSGTYNGENNQNISIGKSLSIYGEDSTIIDGENKAQLFIMNSSAKLSLNGLILTNAYKDGNLSDYGGAIINEGGQLTIINSTIKNSYGNYYGGAIYNNLGRLTIINSSILNNSAIQYGGAIYTLGVTNIQNSVFEKNTLTAEKGVGASIAAGGTITLNNTDFLNNHAIYSAAALLSLGNATINNCSFINQTTNYTAGAISNHGNMFINNSLFFNCRVRFYAGAILAPPSGHHVVTEVYNTIFDYNNAGNHGAVTNNFQDAEITMINCAITNNYIQKNVFYGDIALDDNATVQYCWWGQNNISSYYYSPHSNNEDPGQINASRWLMMSFTSSNGNISADEVNTLTVSIKQYFDNDTKEIYEYNEDINLPLTVKFFDDNKKTIATKTLKNGTASYNYIPVKGVNAVYAQITNEIIEIPVVQKKESNLSTSNLTKYYKNESQLEAKLTDGDNNPLSNKTISIELLGKTYNKTTNENGIVKQNIGLKPGQYTANIIFKDPEYKNKNITVQITVLKNSTSISAKNLVKYYKNSSQLTVKLLDNNKKAMKSKKVKFTIGKNTYTRTTNANGAATFNINLKVGTYNVKVSFGGDDYYKGSSKTVKVTVKTTKMQAKSTKIRKNSNFVATFKDANGKVIKNTKVKFTLNKKTYTKTTNSKGQATLKVSVKLGSYTIKSQYASTKTYGATVFNTKIKVIK